MWRHVLILILVVSVAGCSVGPVPVPTAVVSTQVSTQTAQPTYTPNPTFTPQPTYTPLPTFTPMSTPTALPTATATNVPTPTPVIHVVQVGDTLNAIAAKYNVSLEAIMAANAIQNMDLVEVNRPLVIPLSGTLSLSETVSVTITPRPVVRPALPTRAPAAPAGFIYPASKLLRPVNGTNFLFNARSRDGGVDTVTFEWASVGKLENGAQECKWPGLPNGDIGFMYDRYQIEFDPPLMAASGKAQSIYNNDHGLIKTFSLLEFRWGITYTWRVVVVRWCMPKYDKTARTGSLGQVSPYSEPMTFSYSH